jgi:prepilin-type N-terminal cleavage/methylation domain-containing protein
MMGHGARSHGGFSMVELLVTIVLAGIIFTAMVPFFVNALSQTSKDARRNDAEIIAQDRIEQARLLPYADLEPTDPDNPLANYLQNPAAFTAANPGKTLGDNRFGATYTPLGQRAYQTQYQIYPQADSEKIVVMVTPPKGASFSASTVVKDPAPNIVSEESGGSSDDVPTTNLTIVVSFKNWSEVVANSSKGVFYTCTAPDGSVTTSTHKWPTSTSHTVTFTGLTGGTGYWYTVTVYSSTWQGGNTPMVCARFHCLSQPTPKWFDTHPGGS